MRYLQAVLLFAGLHAMMACTMSPEEISWKSSDYLCQQYYSVITLNYMNTDILDELLMRGIGACTNSALNAARENEMMQIRNKGRLPVLHRFLNIKSRPKQ